jgi:hypothetical protein
MFGILHRQNRGKHEQFIDAWCKPCRKAYKSTPEQLAKATERARIRRRIDPEFREMARSRAETYYEKNREVVLAKMRETGKAGGWLDSRLRRKFGIGLKEYQEMHEAQGGLCKLCGRPERTKQRRLVVDHCHFTGKIRGLLCHHCNTGLGNFMDDSSLLLKAVSYLGDTA